MKRITLTRSALALIAAASVVLGGCSDTTDTPNPRDGASTASAARDLTQAATRLQQDTYKMTMTLKVGDDSGRLTGVIDPKKKVGSYTATTDRVGSTATQWRVIGNVLYLQMTTPGGTAGYGGKTWRRINSGMTTADWYDGAAMTTSFEKAADVRRVGDHGFTGTLDLGASAKAIGVPAPKASSSGPSRVPFEVDTDNAGRLVRYTLDTPDGDNGTNKVTIAFSDFGVPVNVQAPAASEISTTPDR